MVDIFDDNAAGRAPGKGHKGPLLGSAKPACIPSGDRPTYSAAAGLS